MFRKICEITAFKRENKTVDIVKRIGAITADRIHLKRYPKDNPVTAFNPGLILVDGELKLYVRIVLGYFTYASAVAEITIPLEEVEANAFPGHYSGDIVVFPDNRYDIWGVEDPRVYRIGDEIMMTYCGRTVSYFDPSIRVERTLPVCAKKVDKKWKKTCVFRFPRDMRSFVVSDKDAFLVKTKDGIKLFHRPHMRDENFYLTVSDVDGEGELGDGGLKEIPLKNTAIAYEAAEFEEKIGWGTPPVKVDNEYLFFVHAVARELKFYRVFALLMDEDLNVVSVTPHYIMEPREIYEVYGDRPYTIFPCGAEIVDDKIIISYGAADSAVGLGEIKIDEIMSELDKNRCD